MKVPTHHSRETVSMAELSSNPARGVTPGMSTDKGRRMQGPRRMSAGGHKTFGVPLTELVHRAPQGYTVPFIVKKVCTFIEHNGMNQEGIFRVNGSQKVVEKLKLQFDHHGHANLEEDGDIMAVAGLLKLFLRELPESVIPEHMTRRFVSIQEEFQRNASECVTHLKSVLNDLPKVHYELLKHVVRFLAIVSCNEPVNKMSPMALAIVFGPNLFRCGKGFLALKDQGTTNQIVYRFIVDYDNLFKDLNEDSPAVYWERKKHNLVPPRPPPPKFQKEEIEVVSSIKPVPSPRKSKMKNHEGSWYPEHEDQDRSESSISSRGRNSHSQNSPSFSDDEMTGRLSPFHLDSDSGFSLVESPVPSARTSEFVDKAIKATVIGHMFGDESSLLNASIDTTIREDNTEPVSSSVAGSGMNELNRLSSDPGPGVMERVKQIEKTDIQKSDAVSKPMKQKPTSQAFEMFEKKGIIITQMHEEPQYPQENGEERLEPADGQAFEYVRRDSDPLQNFKRPAGPQNRRSPSRKPRSSIGEPESEEMDEQEIEMIPNGHVQQVNSAVTDKPNKPSDNSDINHNQDKTRIAFLDIRHDIEQNRRQETSPDKSPTGNKPFVPPLDFSTLHENVGSQDAIPAHKAGSVSYQRAKQLPQEDKEDDDDDDFENETPSPRSHKVKRKAGPAMEDDDFPPFSQADQDQYKSHSHGSTDDELTSKMKVQMRKVQTLKKKIRHFEEVFERENGYKPSHAEKASKPEVKKFMLELSKARKEAKKLKEEAEMGSRSRHGSGASSTGERTDPPELPPTMAQTLDGILKRLQDKRRDTNRPEDVELMNPEQVQEEKLAVQKALLHFEGIHGRPKSKEEKDLMRPLYDRYRMIKRMLSRQPMSPRRTLELQTVPEDQPMVDTGSQNKFVARHNYNKNQQNQLNQIQNRQTVPVTVEPVKKEPIRVPTALIENNEEGEEDYVSLGTMDFAVTRDFSILKTRPKAVDNQGPHSPKARRKLEMLENNENRNLPDSNLHELSIPELQDELLKSRNVKKKLRKTLREFEESFTRRTGRKVGREDRMPMQAEYNEYKQLKARLKLLEALLSKHRPTEV